MLTKERAQEIWDNYPKVKGRHITDYLLGPKDMLAHESKFIWHCMNSLQNTRGARELTFTKMFHIIRNQ